MIIACQFPISPAACEGEFLASLARHCYAGASPPPLDSDPYHKNALFTVSSTTLRPAQRIQFSNLNRMCESVPRSGKFAAISPFPSDLIGTGAGRKSLFRNLLFLSVSSSCSARPTSQQQMSRPNAVQKSEPSSSPFNYERKQFVIGQDKSSIRTTIEIERNSTRKKSFFECEMLSLSSFLSRFFI
jgi:hypothetical protein